MEKTFLTTRLLNTWPEAGERYGWGKNVPGLCIEYNFLSVCEMAGKDAMIMVKGRKKSFRIAPTVAKEVAKEHRSFFTRRRDSKVIVVVPITRCEAI